MNYFAKYGSEDTANLTVDSTKLLLNKEERNHLPQDVLQLLQDGLTYSLHTVYYVVLFLAIISVLLIWLLPRKKPESSNNA